MHKEEEVDFIKKSKEKTQTLLEKFDIPIDHISYEYIGECKKTKELERIIRILRSGEEGTYPHLTKFAEDRLRVLKPDSALLRVIEPVIPRSALPPSERRALDSEVEDWMREMRLREHDLSSEAAECGPLPRPAIRETRESSKPFSGPTPKNEKRLASCDYAAWDKYDADTELNKIDLNEERKKIEAKKLQERRKADLLKTGKDTIIQKSLLTNTELNVMAAREREKGNEAFRAGDYHEALQFYTTSIAMDYDVNAYNNRAMTHIKLKNYEKAIKDCDAVLKIDCMNFKALLRRGLAFQEVEKNFEALKDYEAALQIDPTNKIAISCVNKLRAADESRKVRLTIEEI